MVIDLMKNAKWLKFYKPKGHQKNEEAALIFAL